MPKSKKKSYIKVIDEQFIIPYDKGGGIIKFEAWEYENQIVKYNMVYINKSVFPNDKLSPYVKTNFESFFIPTTYATSSNAFVAL